jgi:hypothetical protein
MTGADTVPGIAVRAKSSTRSIVSSVPSTAHAMATAMPATASVPATQ